MRKRPTPPMPTSQAEWECHWAFYQLTVMQRDAAWRQLEDVRQRDLAWRALETQP